MYTHHEWMMRYAKGRTDGFRAGLIAGVALCAVALAFILVALYT